MFATKNVLVLVVYNKFYPLQSSVFVAEAHNYLLINSLFVAEIALLIIFCDISKFCQKK